MTSPTATPRALQSSTTPNTYGLNYQPYMIDELSPYTSTGSGSQITPTSTTPGNSSTYGNYRTGPTAGENANNYTGGTNGLGSSLGNLGNLLGGGSLGNLALYGGLYELLSSQASSAANENSALAGQITQVGQPAVNESQNLLGSYSQGALTGPFQAQLQTALTANQQQATSQEQQAARALAGASGGQNTSGALLGQTQQIQSQQSQLDTQAVSNAFAGELAGSNSLLQAGGGYVQAGVTQEINSNTQLQAQLSQLMGALASAYAQSTTGGTAAKPSSGSGSGGSGSGGKGSSGSGSSGSGGGALVQGSDSNATGPYGHFSAADYTNGQPLPGGLNPSNYTGDGSNVTGIGDLSGTVPTPYLGGYSAGNTSQTNNNFTDTSGNSYGGGGYYA